MASRKPPPKRARRSADAPPPAVATPSPWSSRAFRVQAIAVFVLAFAAHSSSLRNQYALDDELIILRNVPVQRGIAGIGEIMTSDAYASYHRSLGGEAQLTGGRYRPLSVVTFAIEQSLFGRTLGDEYDTILTEWNAPSADPRLGERLDDVERRVREANREIAFHRHLVQLLLYAGSMVVLLLFLTRCVFPSSPMAAFVATLLFALHPIHTEVVANVKSRDEILSLLFILLTGLALFEWDRTRKRGAMLWTLAWLLLALLAKEYAVVAPLVLGAALVLVRGRSVRAVLTSFVVPMMLLVVGYVIARQSLVGSVPAASGATQDILTDPFLKLKTGEMSGSVLATKIDILDHYLRLLVFPHPLSSDYSYATFAYQSFASIGFWLSLLIHVALVALTIHAWRKRHILAFAGIVYFGFLALVANLVIDIGATMGERLIYHSSLGFTLLLGWAMAKLPRAAAVAVCVVIAAPYAVASFARDRVWYDNRSLFLTDVRTVPRSALANSNAGAEILDDALDRIRARNESNIPLTPADREAIKTQAARALVYLRRAVSIHDRYANAWINVGIAHYYREEWEQAGDAFARAAAIAPSHPTLRQYATNFHMLGTALARGGDLEGASAMFARAAAAAPNEIRFHIDRGASAFMDLRFRDARAAFEQALKIAPNHPQAAQGFAAASEYERLTRAAEERPNDPDAFAELAAALERNPAPSFAAAARDARARSEQLRGQ